MVIFSLSTIDDQYVVSLNSVGRRRDGDLCARAGGKIVSRSAKAAAWLWGMLMVVGWLEMQEWGDEKSVHNRPIEKGVQTCSGVHLTI